MKKVFIVFVIVVILSASLGSCNDEGRADNKETDSQIVDIVSFDGYVLKGRLTLPEDSGNVSKLVLFVNGSGPNTYLNRRPGFDYFDFYADEFSSRGIAFFSYSTRGVDIGDTPPMFNEINEEEYQTYLPSTSVEDVYCMINDIKKNERLKDCKVYLLGWSEGAIIAPLIAEKYPNSIDGLFLAGYPNQNMKDVLIWQNTGNPSMVWYRNHFETDEQGRISRASYEADPNNVVSSVLQNALFENLDSNGDSFLSKEDFAFIVQGLVGYSLEEVLAAIENRDDEWLKTNYGDGLIPLTSAWFLEHFSIRSNMDVLPELDLPIYIFHGTLDQNVDVNEVYKVNDKFKELGKTNLTINVFEKHDHNLNYEIYIQNKEIPDGIQAIFDAIDGM